MTEKNKAYFVTSKNFHGDEGYFHWLKEIKSRYQNIRSRVALQANYGALEFNWLLGRDIIQQKAESRWGAGVVNQLSLDLKAQSSLPRCTRIFGTKPLLHEGMV